LSPHPEHPDYDGYHEIVMRCMKLDKHGDWKAIVPGWDIYPQSRSCKLVEKRLADRYEKLPDGVSRIEKRQLQSMKRLEQKFTQMAA